MTNKTYTKHRNALIPEAERYANSIVGGLFLKGEKRLRWSKAYLRRMDELCVQEGLCQEWVLEKYREVRK